MASRYPLNLPADLKREAALLAKQQGISLNQFFLWSITEKVATLKTSQDDPHFPRIIYRRGASGIPTPVIRGTGIRVQTLVVAHFVHGESPQSLAEKYDLPIETVLDALSFYEAHREIIDAIIRIEDEIAARHDKTETAS